MSNEPDKIIYSMIRVSKYYDKKPVLKNIKVPTLVLRSEQDPWVDVASSQYIFDRIGGMARRIQTIPSQRHNPFRDAGAFKEVKRAVKEFMSDIVATM